MPAANGTLIQFPAEPPHDIVIEARNQQGGMTAAWRWNPGKEAWVTIGGQFRSGNPFTWPVVVANVLACGWDLYACAVPQWRS